MIPTHLPAKMDTQSAAQTLSNGDGAQPGSTVVLPLILREEDVPRCLAATELFSFGEVVHAMPVGGAASIECPQRLNDVRFLNKFIEAVNTRLTDGGLFRGRIETKGQRKRRILAKYPAWFAWPYYCGDFVFKRIFPKLPVTKQIYFAVTNGRNRVLSRTEMLGRLASCGFEIVDLENEGGYLHFAARKISPPLYPEHPTYGLFVTLKRMGKDGEIIDVYKLRTMHPYSEYIQDYVFAQNGLAEGGKIKDDMRVTSWGRVMRKFWIDEIPMVWNLLKRDLQFVGVRPLSEHYHDLYPAALVERRLKHRPGLLPVIYADGPHNGIEDIAAAEERYLDAYEKAPFRTNVRYFFRIVHAIVFRGVRSQ